MKFRSDKSVRCPCGHVMRESLDLADAGLYEGDEFVIVWCNACDSNFQVDVEVIYRFTSPELRARSERSE